MPRLTASDARDISRSFHDLAVSIGRYRFDNWSKLSPSERTDLESREWTLLNDSSDMTSRAIILQVDDMKSALEGIKAATKRLNKTAKSFRDFRSAISVASKAISLGAAIMTGNPIAIAEAIAST
ncbi:MAG TPA: hypothetical protein VM939_07615 [Gemmatimonadaceae bacterium]|nr:hypothetical protein [Gemmatimonadaceae bacterium]